MKPQTSGKRRNSGIPRLLEIAGTKRWWLIGSMLLAVAAAIAQFTPYVAVYKILEELAAKASTPKMLDKELIWSWAFISLGAMLVWGVLVFTSGMLSHIAAFNILYELRVALAHKLARLPLGYFSRRASGEIKKIMSEDVERIELFVAHHIPDMTQAVIFPLLVLGYLLMVDWRMALIILLVFIASFTIQASMLSSPKAKKSYASHHAALGRMNASIVEYVRGIQVVKIFSRSTKSFEQLRNDIDNFKDLCVTMSREYALTYTGFLTLLSSTILFIIPLAVFILLQAPSYAEFVPRVFLFIILGGGLFFPLLKLLYMGSYLAQNSMGVGLIDEILDKPEINEPEHQTTPQDGSIRFDKVTFAYEEKPVLKDVSFTADTGTITALVGPSGAGKTTIAMLSARFWDVSAGEIVIGGAPIKEIATSTLMDHVAFVFQDNMLFFDTIEENIRMGNSSAPFDAVVEAASAAQCHDFIQSLEAGYQTRVGEGGTYLSGGEQQRIALARVILKDAPIVILDEATAFADPENEGKILAAFARLVKNKTVLVIAHRLSTITNADKILVINEGTIIEQGKHNDLVKQGGLYDRMWQSYSKSRQWVLGSDTSDRANTAGGTPAENEQ